jgi:hypothetical protein
MAGGYRDPNTVRRRIRFILASLLLVLLLLLFSPRLTGLRIHEWMGIAFILPIMVHIALSWRWIASVTRRLIRGASARLRVNYALNALLFVLLVLVLGSGIAISEVAMPAFGVDTVDDRSWRAVHNLTLNWLLLLTALHIGLNWDWVQRTIRPVIWRRPWAVGPMRAGSLGRGASRSLMIAAAACTVMVVAVALLGVPSPARRYAMNELSRFAGSPWRGAVQLTGQAFLLFAAGYSGRRWLHIRL